MNLDIQVKFPIETFAALRKSTEVYMPLDYPKAKIEILVSSKTELYARTASCRREPGTVTWLESLDENSVLFDIGANVGAYSLVAASLNKKIKVFSFEPHYGNFAKLCSNIEHNRLTHSIVPIYAALGDKTEIGELYHWDEYEKGEPGSSGHQLNRTLTEEEVEFKPVLKQFIPAFSVSDFCKIYSVYPNAIKIDVDGIEDLIVKGAQFLFESKKVKTILIEVNKKSSGVIKDLMESWGYRLQSVGEHNNQIYNLA